MKKSLLSLFLLAFSAYSLDKYTIPYAATDTMTKANFDSNHDTTKAYIDKVIDTVNLNVPRYTQNTYTHDLIMPFLRVDTIRSNTNIDSICGSPRIDTLSSDSAYAYKSTSHYTNADSATIGVITNTRINSDYSVITHENSDTVTSLYSRMRRLTAYSGDYNGGMAIGQALIDDDDTATLNDIFQLGSQNFGGFLNVVSHAGDLVYGQIVIDETGDIVEIYDKNNNVSVTDADGYLCFVATGTSFRTNVINRTGAQTRFYFQFFGDFNP